MVEISNKSLSGSLPALPVPKHGETRPRKRLRLLLLWLVILLALAPIMLVAGYLTVIQQYERDIALGKTGEQHLRTAADLLLSWSKRPFEVGPIKQAEQEFRATGGALSQVVSDLQIWPAFATQLPTFGPRLATARRLVDAVQGLSQAGVAGCQLLETLLPVLTNPLGGDGKGLTSANMELINRLFPQMNAGLLRALNSAEQLQAGDLSFDSHLAQKFASLRQKLPLVRTLLGDLSGLVPALPALLGVKQPAHYLLEILDSSELRPGGGFVGNIGVLTLAGGRFESAHVQDVMLLDKKVKDGSDFIAFPAAYRWLSSALHVPSWSVRDSNLDADFPKNAQNVLANYAREGGQGQMQGVIAITPALIQHALEITGPIFMPEYQETVTAQNLIDLIHYHQLGAGSEGNSSQLTADGKTSLRKRFTEVLSQHFMAQMRHLSSAKLGQFASLLFSSLASKDIQVYLKQPAAESLLRHLHLASTVEAPVGDSLFVVDANTAGNKANAYIQTTMQDQVTLDRDGNAQHHLTLSYTWNTPGQIYGTGFYRSYVRIYVPPGSRLARSQGWERLGGGSAYGRIFWAGTFRMHYGETITLDLSWNVPHIAVRAAGVDNWQYNYLLQRQAGTAWEAQMQLNLASCKLTGVHIPEQHISQPRQAIWSDALGRDTTLGANYNCTGL